MVTAGFNSSTLKAKYSTNSKQCVGCCGNNIPSGCEWCSPTQPASVFVTFEDIVSQPCCDVLFLQKDWKAEGVGWVNGTYELPVEFISGDPTCGYSKDLGTIPSGLIRYYNSTDGSCSGGTFATETLELTQIALAFFETGINFQINTWRDGITQSRIFEGFLTYTGGDVCGSSENVVSNTVALCPTLLHAGYSGTATISLT